MPKKFQQRQLVLAERTKLKKYSKQRGSSPRLSLKLLLRVLIFPWYVTYVILGWLLVEKPWELMQLFKDKLERAYQESKLSYEKGKGQKEPKMEPSRKEKEKEKEKKKSVAKGLIAKLVYVIREFFSIVMFFIFKIYHSKDTSMAKLKWVLKKVYQLWRDTETILYKIEGFPFAIVRKLKRFMADVAAEPDLDIDLDDLLDESLSPIDSPSPLSIRSSRQFPLRTCSRCTRLLRSNAKCNDSRSLMTDLSSSQRPTLYDTYPHVKFDDSMKMPSGMIQRLPPLSREDLIDGFFLSYDAMDERPRSRNSQRVMSSGC